MTGRGIRAGVVAALAAGAVLLAGAPAGAVPAGTIGTFPTWTVSGAGGAYTGSATFASPTLPSPTIASTASGITTSTGGSTYLAAGTGFGTEYGATRAQPYLTIGAATGGADSVTTIDFGATAPATGWGFALGDVDVDTVTIAAFDAAGTPIPPSIATFGSQGPANYCNTSPKPSACSGVTTFDVPGFDPATGILAGSNTGNTTGAYDWFIPSPDVRRLTFTYHVLSGIPSYQLWLAQPAPVTTITGSVVVSGGGAVPAGTSVRLDAADGTPVLNVTGDPVTAPVSTADGGFALTTEQRAGYQLQVVPPTGYATPLALSIVATTPTVAAPAIGLDPAATTAPATTPTGPVLAESGVDGAPALVVGVAVLLLGMGLLTARRTRRR